MKINVKNIIFEYYFFKNNFKVWTIKLYKGYTAWELEKKLESHKNIINKWILWYLLKISL